MKKNKNIFNLLKNLKLGDECLFHVSSNSMWPLIDINDKVVLQKTKINNIKKFDIIIFYSNEFGELLAHRVTTVNKNKDIELETKGDNNVFKDNILINKNNFLGKITINKSKKINFNKNNYSWLSFCISNQLFLKIKRKLFYFFYNSRLGSRF